MNSFNKSNVKYKFYFFIFATLCSFPQHLNKHEKVSITLLFPYTFSSDFWGLRTNVIEHGSKIFNSAGAPKPRVVCTRIGTFELRDPEDSL